MSSGLRIKILSAAAALLATVALGATASASGGGAQKVTLLAHPSGSCNIGATGGASTDAFAVINAPGDNAVSAEVSVNDGLPHASYAVSLVQTPSGAHCFTPGATLTTDAAGHGNVHLSEPLMAGTRGAFVLVFHSSDIRATKAVSVS